MQTGAAPTHRQVCATLGSRGSVGPQVVQHAVHHWRPGPLVGCQPPSMFRSGGCASARRRGAAAAAAAGMAGMACPGACPCLRPASPRGFEGQRRPASGERRHTSRATQLPVTDLRTDCKGDRLRTAQRLQRRRSRRQPFDPPLPLPAAAAQRWPWRARLPPTCMHVALSIQAHGWHAFVSDEGTARLLMHIRPAQVPACETPEWRRSAAGVSHA